MAIVGGVIVPLITGSLADMSTIAGALIVPIIYYGVIACGLYARKLLAA
jgi:fucose permease